MKSHLMWFPTFIVSPLTTGSVQQWWLSHVMGTRKTKCATQEAWQCPLHYLVPALTLTVSIWPHRGIPKQSQRHTRPQQGTDAHWRLAIVIGPETQQTLVFQMDLRMAEEAVCRVSSTADMPGELGVSLFKHRLFILSAVKKYKQWRWYTGNRYKNESLPKMFHLLMSDCDCWLFF